MTEKYFSVNHLKNGPTGNDYHEKMGKKPGKFLVLRIL